jgi:hypothetical protein
MCGLDLPPVQHDLAFCVDEGLGDVEAGSITLAISEDNEYLGLFNGGTDAVHFWGYSRHRVGHVFVDKFGVFNDAFRPYCP